MEQDIEKELEIEKGLIKIRASLVCSGFSQYQKYLDLAANAIDKLIQDESLGIVKMNMVFNLSLVSAPEIRAINLEHRAKDTQTDVLSFPLQENMRKGIFDKFSKRIELGDLIIAKEVCEKQAKEFNISYYDEFIHLVFHGFLHLVGYDHELNQLEEKIMFSLEDKLVDMASKLKS